MSNQQKMRKIMENVYESPELSVVECQIEKGFAASPDSDHVDIGGEGTPD